MGETVLTEGSKTSQKESAVEFLQLVVAGRIDEAYQRHVDMNGRHHNLLTPQGFLALKKSMAENHVQLPNKQLMVKNVLSDGDLVAVHSKIVVGPGEQGIATVHLLRLQNSRIVEMWDDGQTVPADSPNKDGAF